LYLGQRADLRAAALLQLQAGAGEDSMKLRIQIGAIVRLGLLLSLTGLSNCAPAEADLTVFLEEPYSYDGGLAGTGHTAVYLSNICASSPTLLRRCNPGETGAVLSRYHRIAGYDWLAIPVIPYLFAVERPDDIPLIADAKIAVAMRDGYRRKYLEAIIPDGPEGQMPAGDWYELLGSAFDRTIYGFRIATTTEKDDAFIAVYNARANHQAYKLVTSNCADFVRDVVNFYYPNAATRSFFADLDVATPKHVAKSLVKYAHHHENLPFTAFVIPQIPGSIKRSTPIHGVVDSVFKAKKYEIPLLVFHPFVGGGVAVAYVVSGRFNPSQNALMYSPGGALERPLSDEQRRNYAKGLEELLRSRDDGNSVPRNPAQWRALQSTAIFVPDEHGRPALRAPLDGDSLPTATRKPSVVIGLTRDNILNSTAPASLTRDLLIVRLRQELSKGTSPHTSERMFRSDLALLEKLLATRYQTPDGGAYQAVAER
jgi:hypothetical protein